MQNGSENGNGQAVEETEAPEAETKHKGPGTDANGDPIKVGMVVQGDDQEAGLVVEVRGDALIAYHLGGLSRFRDPYISMQCNGVEIWCDEIPANVFQPAAGLSKRVLDIVMHMQRIANASVAMDATEVDGKPLGGTQDAAQGFADVMTAFTNVLTDALYDEAEKANASERGEQAPQ